MLHCKETQPQGHTQPHVSLSERSSYLRLHTQLSLPSGDTQVCASQPSLLTVQITADNGPAHISDFIHSGIQSDGGISHGEGDEGSCKKKGGHGQDDFFPLPPFRQDSVPRMRASCPKLLSEQLLWSHLHLWGLKVNTVQVHGLLTFGLSLTP